MDELYEVASKFNLDGNVKNISKYGCGHINVTFLIETDKKRYILQEINSNLFKDVSQLMSNINLVTKYIKSNFNDKETLTLIDTVDGDCYLEDCGKYYRVYEFIENTVCLQTVSNENEFYQSAKSFGEFAMMLSKFDATKLYDILPNFHNTKVRYQNLMKAIELNKANRKHLVEDEIKFSMDRKEFASLIVDQIEKGIIPLKVTHNDTKLNNILLDSKTLTGKAVIDLDTIMPGSIVYDFGDSIRFGCNSGLEDEPDLNKVHFRKDLFEVYVKGYLEALGKSISLSEKNNLVNGAIMMTYECGIRFLSDYLDGDVYFHTTRDNQNLDRCHTQFRLVSEMEENKKELEAIVDKYYNMYSI